MLSSPHRLAHIVVTVAIFITVLVLLLPELWLFGLSSRSAVKQGLVLEATGPFEIAFFVSLSTGNGLVFEVPATGCGKDGGGVTNCGFSVPTARCWRRRRRRTALAETTLLAVLSKLRREPREEPEQLRQCSKPRAPPTGSVAPRTELRLRLSSEERVLSLAPAPDFGVGGAVLRDELRECTEDGERGMQLPGEDGDRGMRPPGEDERGEGAADPGDDGNRRGESAVDPGDDGIRRGES
jgi:hypothetical protein